MSEPSAAPQPEDQSAADQSASEPAASGADQAYQPKVEPEYAEGSTNDPGGAERESPAGEDYAGSGF